MYGESSSSSVVCIPKEVRTDLWLSKTSDAEKSVRLYVGFPGSKWSLGPRSIGRIDPVDPADPRNGTRRSGGSDRIVRHAPKRRSKSIQYGGRLSNVLTTCFYMNYGRYIELCCQNDAICYESDIILQKSTSLLRFPSLFSKYWYSGLSAVRMCSLYFMVETDWIFILFSRITS